MRKFEINIARADGRNWNNTAPAFFHFARIELGKADNDEAAALEQFAIFETKFPAPEWHLALSVWINSGRTVAESL